LTKPDVVVQVLDGRDTIGGTKIAVGWQGEGAFLDFGINYARWGRYYEEYLKPRSAVGLGDLWKLRLIPRFAGLYRKDVIPPGLREADAMPVGGPSGVFLSHAHLDHAGLIGLLQPRVPIIASPLTAAILKAGQDSGKSELWTSPCYSNQYKRQTVGKQEVFRSDSKAPALGRRLLVPEGSANGSLTRFWSTFPWVDESDQPQEMRSEGVGLYRGETGLSAKAHLVDHSVLGGSAFILESPNGPIVYTGDLRAHGKHAESTIAFLEGLKRRRPYALLIEGTQVHAPGRLDAARHEPRTEAGVAVHCLSAVDAHRGRLVLADFAPRNVERLLTFLDVARRTHRKLVVFPKDAYLLYAMHQADASIPLPGGDLVIYDPPAGTEGAWEKWLLQSQFPNALVSSEELRRAPGDFILCFSYFDLKHLLDLEPAGGAYIYSNSEAHGEEAEIDFGRLHNWLTFFGLDVLGFQMTPDPQRGGKLRPQPVGGYHCSGHMPGDDVLDWVVQIHPDHLVPVHTEHANGFVEAVRELTDVRVNLEGLVR